MIKSTSWTLCFGSALCLLAAVTGVCAFSALVDTKTKRAEATLECIRSMPEAAPLVVTQADPDYAYEAATAWCYRFVSGGGKAD